jgi:curved DNA-binding protein CbpA
MIDYYSILGVKKNASPSLIRKSYIRLSIENHPKTNKTNSSSDTFILINQAYQILKDITIRQKYNLLFENEYEGKNHKFTLNQKLGIHNVIQEALINGEKIGRDYVANYYRFEDDLLNGNSNVYWGLIGDLILGLFFSSFPFGGRYIKGYLGLLLCCIGLYAIFIWIGSPSDKWILIVAILCFLYGISLIYRRIKELRS